MLSLKDTLIIEIGTRIFALLAITGFTTLFVYNAIKAWIPEPAEIYYGETLVLDLPDREEALRQEVIMMYSYINELSDQLIKCKGIK